MFKNKNYICIFKPVENINDTMNEFTVSRKKEWANRMRSIRLYADDQKVAEISNGETKMIQFPPGKVNLQAKIDWAGSNVLEIDAYGSRNRTIELSSFLHRNKMLRYFMYFGFGLSVLSVAIALMSPIGLISDAVMYILLAFSIAFLSIITYFISIGRKRYLYLRETIDEV